MIAAFATDDGRTFMDRHFGDARYYDVYDLAGDPAVFLQRLDNTSGEERRHADPRKAGNVATLLQETGVRVVVSRVFGPNLKRIRHRFVCVVTAEQEIANAVARMATELPVLNEVWAQGEQRAVLRQLTGGRMIEIDR